MFSENIKRNFIVTFAIVALAINLLHYQAEKNIRGSIPPHSDSLVYQDAALKLAALMQKGECTSNVVLFGGTVNEVVPPLFKLSLILGYVVLGIDNFSPYFISGLWLILGALSTSLLLNYCIKDDLIAFGGGMLLMGIPGSLTWAFMESRNDWPVVSLCMTSFYFFARSDLFSDRKTAFLGALFAGLALLTKSSLAGYLLFPATFLAAGMFIYRKALGVGALKNIALSFCIIIAVSGWFYAARGSQILEYYSYWATINIENVRTQYQLNNFWDEILFYPKNLLNQFGPATLAIVVSGWVVLAWKASVKRDIPRGSLAFTYGWAAVFAFGPYLMLISNKSYASIADINMLPFHVFLGVAGLSIVSNSPAVRRRIALVLIVFGICLNVVSLKNHYSQNYYKGVNAEKAVRELVSLLDEVKYGVIEIMGVYHDIYFNAETVVNVIHRDAILRTKLRASMPSSLDAGEAHTSPKATPRKRYDTISQAANLILIPDSPPQYLLWITINREWKEMAAMIAEDSRFTRLGKIHPYDNGVGVEVYAKEKASIAKESDGWLANGGEIAVFAKPGRHVLTVEGKPHDKYADDMSLVKMNGEKTPGSKCQSIRGGCFEFVIDVADQLTSYTLDSNTPLIPSSLNISADSRKLLFHNPSASMKTF